MIFDRKGALVRAIGRPGRGPGEFSYPQHLQFKEPDTLVVWDEHFGSVTSFDTVGRIQRIDRIDLAKVVEAVGPGHDSESFTPLPDGSYVAHVSRRGSIPVGRVYRPDWGFAWLGPDDESTWLGWYGGLAQMKVSGSQLPALPPFPALALVVGAGRPSRILITNGDSGEVREFSNRGSLIRIIRFDKRPLFDQNVVDSTLNMLRKRARSPEARRILELVLEQVQTNSFFPAVSQMVVDSEGFLWACTLLRKCSVFAADGVWLGVVPVELTRIHEIGADYILGVSKDSLERESIIELPLKRAR
jgi:hypothetical protein